ASSKRCPPPSWASSNADRLAPSPRGESGISVGPSPSVCACDVQNVRPGRGRLRSVGAAQPSWCLLAPARLGAVLERSLLGSTLPGCGGGDLVASPPTHRHRSSLASGEAGTASLGALPRRGWGAWP